MLPCATMIGFLRVGRLLKSQPIKAVKAVQRF